MLLGYTLAAISVMGAVKTAATIALVVPAIVLGLPILDTLFAIVRRKIVDDLSLNQIKVMYTIVYWHKAYLKNKQY